MATKRFVSDRKTDVSEEPLFPRTSLETAKINLFIQGLVGWLLPKFVVVCWLLLVVVVCCFLFVVCCALLVCLSMSAEKEFVVIFHIPQPCSAQLLSGRWWLSGICAGLAPCDCIARQAACGA